MLAAELRYLGTALLIIALMVGAVLAAHSTRLGESAELFIAFCLFVLALLALMLWFVLSGRKRTTADAQPSVSARYVPRGLGVLAIGFALWSTVQAVSTALATHQPLSDSFFMTLYVFALIAFLNIWPMMRRRLGLNTEPFDRARMARMEAAYALPTRAEGRRAMRPLVYRGYIRLLLLGGMPAAFFLLFPRLGAALAFPVAFGGTVGLFFIGHWLFDL